MNQRYTMANQWLHVGTATISQTPVHFYTTQAGNTIPVWTLLRASNVYYIPGQSGSTNGVAKISGSSSSVQEPRQSGTAEPKSSVRYTLYRSNVASIHYSYCTSINRMIFVVVSRVGKWRYALRRRCLLYTSPSPRD